MQSIQKYIDRLYKEWKEHGKIIIGVDFDDTISPWKLKEKEECEEIIKYIKEAIYTGAYLVIHTSCNKDRYPEIMKYCQSYNLKVDSINENPINLPYGHDKSKPMCNLYLDDRAGLNEAIEILRVVMYRIRGDIQERAVTEHNSL